MKTKFKHVRRKNVAVQRALKLVDGANYQGLVECLKAGLPAVVEQYGFHSYEVRSAQLMIEKLENQHQRWKADQSE